LPSPWERNRWVILTSFFLESMAWNMVTPFVPLYVQELGVTEPPQIALWSGLILGVGPLGVALMLPLWDRMAERTGRKFQVLRALAGYCLAMAAATASRSALHLFFSYLFDGLSSGFYPQTWNLVSTGAPAGGVASAMGLLQSVDLLVSALGPFLGGFLGDRLGFRPSYALAVALGVMAFMVMWLGYKEEDQNRQEGFELHSASPSRDSGLSLRKLATIRGLLPILAMNFLVVSLVGGVRPLVPLFLQSLVSPDAPVATLSGLAIAAGSMVAALAAFMLGRMTLRWSARNLVVFCLLAGGVATALVAATPSLEVAFAMWVIRSALTGGILALLYGVADSQLPPKVAKVAFANLTGAMIFGYAAGPLFTGILGALDVRAAFIIVGAGLALMGLWAARAFSASSSRTT
jgi:DHA1 family multidrug resistance protein-like MFS transporter